MTFQDNPTNWDKHFDDLMERALKRMYWSLECVKEMVIVYLILITSLIASSCRFLLTLSELGVLLLNYTKYLSQIDRLLRRAFWFGYIQHIWRHGRHIDVPKQWNRHMLVFQVNPVGVELFSYVTFFCSHKFAYMLATWVKTLCSLKQQNWTRISGIVRGVLKKKIVLIFVLPSNFIDY